MESETHKTLFETARLLTEDEAGGHGGRWALFDDNVEEFFSNWLQLALQDGVSLKHDADSHEFSERRLLSLGEPQAAGIFYSDDPEQILAGMLSVIALNVECEETGETASQFYSAYPVFQEGIRFKATVKEIGLQPNRLEAWLELQIGNERSITAFDTLFWQNRAVYQVGETYDFTVSALAYSIELVDKKDEVVIDDPDQVRQFRAQSAYMGEHGRWDREADGDKTLDEWKPESPEDLEPIHISMAEMCAYLPCYGGVADDAEFRGEIVNVVPACFRLFNVSFWKVDIVVTRIDEEAIIIPFYIAEDSIPDHWQPKVGDYAQGMCWVQAQLAA